LFKSDKGTTRVGAQLIWLQLF